MIDDILFLAQDGFSLVPSRGESKAPCVKWKEFQDRRATEAELRAWHESLQPGRCGIVTGRISGVVAADFDGEPGAALLARWGLKPHIRTGSGGFHVYFEHPGFDVPTLNARSGKEWPWPGLDIRATAVSRSPSAATRAAPTSACAAWCAGTTRGWASLRRWRPPAP